MIDQEVAIKICTEIDMIDNYVVNHALRVDFECDRELLA